VALNDVEVGQDLLSNMGWLFEELISYASRGTQVRAGDLLGSGTCGNGGCLAELWGAVAVRTRPRCDRTTWWRRPRKASGRSATRWCPACNCQAWGEYAGGPSPGLSFTTADWLHSSEIAGIATDT
jgi:hypothetical protein